MADQLANFPLGFNETKDAPPLDLQLDPATINSILNQVEDKPLVLPTPLGDIQILASKRDAVRTLFQNNPIRPRLTITYQTTGDCQSFGSITIDKVNAQVTGTHSINLTAFGFGVEIKARPEITGEVIREMPCPQNEKQKVRKFRIDWFLDISISPGVGNTQLVKQFEQLVTTPCCAKAVAPPPETGTHQSPREEPKKKSGWLD